MKTRIRSLIASLLFACLFPFPVGGAEKPVLVIDPGGHKAVIWDVIFTKDSRHLVSASNDKTIRVWDVRTGGISRVIRGQIGVGPEGKIYAAALSPDNEWLAVGGAIGFPNKRWIRLYHFPTGRLAGLLKGHGNLVSSIAFSPDSRFLASGSADKTVRVWDVSGKRAVHTLKGHKNYIYALAWFPDGRRLISGSDDHTLMIWDGETGRRIKTLTGHGDDVVSVAVSPDGRHIVSGSWDKTLRLWDGRSGAFVKVLGKQNRTVGSLSFSPDGTEILTGHGKVSGVRANNLFTVPQGKKRLSFTRHNNIVLATAISPDGRLAATGGGDDNLIYLWDVNTGAVKQTLSGKGKSVWSVGFSRDGRSVAWGNRWTQHNPLNYGPLQRRMRISSGRVEDLGAVDDPAAFVRARETGGGYTLRTKKGGDYGYQAILEVVKDGRVVAEIERDSTSGYDHRSYTLTPDNRTVVSGGMNGVLTLYNTRTGKKIRDLIGHTGDVWAVAASPDGRFLVSGSADQTVRVWNLSTGENLLTLFYASDEEWVAWTRSGYYTASPKGDRYVGWQINKGPNRNPDYFAANQFARILYRPEIVEATVKYGAEKTALARLGAKGSYAAADVGAIAPPELTILRPEDGFRARGKEIDLEVKIGGRTKDVKEIAVLVNGRQVLTPGLKRISGLGSGTIKRFTVPLSAEKNRIKVVVTNKQNAMAEALVSVFMAGEKTKGPEGSLYLLAVGVNHLEHIPGNDLDFPAKDAQDMARLMKQLRGRLFRNVHTHVFSDHGPKKPYSADIEDALYDIRKAQPEDTVMVFLSGHGVTTKENDFLFITRDAKRRGDNTYRMGSVLKWGSIQNVMGRIRARRIILLDTCHSGGVDMTDLIKKGSDSNMVVFASSHGSQTSQERKDLKNGYFTYAILKGLGKGLPADYERDGQVEITELSLYVRKEVGRLTSRQTPTLALPMGQDGFPFYVK